MNLFKEENKHIIYVLFFVFMTKCICVVFGNSNLYDNSLNVSDYVEGKSRYIIMPDENGNPITIDLLEENEEEKKKLFIWNKNTEDSNKYFLFTRLNPTEHQEIIIQKKDLIKKSYFDAKLPLKVVIHGWTGDNSSAMNHNIKKALLKAGDVNVIVVDWGELSSSLYVMSCKHVIKVGEWLGKLLEWLVKSNGASWERMHLIGHSLGAHVAGQAGLYAKGKVDRITGLDPAGPGWSGSENALNFKRARYVECIHTDSGHFGITQPLCDVDFYVNGGGGRQPGCSKLKISCSHSRACDLFASSVQFNGFHGQKCDTLKDAQTNDFIKPKCRGCTMKMGNDDPNKFGSGIFSVETGKEWPFTIESKRSKPVYCPRS